MFYIGCKHIMLNSMKNNWSVNPYSVNVYFVIVSARRDSESFSFTCVIEEKFTELNIQF